jgi:general secretion pathway protein H
VIATLPVPRSGSSASRRLCGRRCRRTVALPMGSYRSVGVDVPVAPIPSSSSLTCNIDGEAGSTLVEIMAVMLIIALVASLAVTMTPGSGRTRLKALALEAAALLRHERIAAILTQHDRRVSVDGERRALIGDGGDVVAIPHDVVLDVLGTDAQWSGRQAVVHFLPNGASSGAVLKFSRERMAYEIRVNWYTGRVAVESPR